MNLTFSIEREGHELGWTFEGDERADLLPAIHLLVNQQDAARRKAMAASRETTRKAWECKLAEAREIHARMQE